MAGCAAFIVPMFLFRVDFPALPPLLKGVLAAPGTERQPAVSRLERNLNRMMVATLRAVVQAMGGKLVHQAHFPDGVVRQIALNDDTADAREAEPATIDFKS